MSTAAELDAATVEVIRNYLDSAANEMQRTLIRTAYNTIIYEILDFGLSMYDRDLDLIADSPGLTSFLGANDHAIRRAVEYVGEENLHDGDIVLMNYPYWNASHTLDASLFMPIYLEDELIGYTISRAHWLDLGAKDSGYVLDSTDMHQEGLVFPGTKVYKRGEVDEGILDLIRFNSRIPDKVIGDLNAQIAALRRGSTRLIELYEKHGHHTVEGAIERIHEHGRETARAAVSDLPDGTWSAVDHVDDDGITDDPVRVEIEVTIDGERFIVDFSNSSDEVAGPINMPLGSTETLCKVCLKTVTTPDEPNNAGHYDPLEVIAPAGNIFHATYPSPTFTLWTSVVGTGTLFKALAKGMPERISASTGGDLCSIMLYGEDPATGKRFVEASNEGVGWGATDERDGPNALMFPTQTMVQNVPIEVYENKAPITFDQLSLREDSGGAGRYRGGLGIRRDYRATAPLGILSIVKKTKTPGWGIEGGEAGAKNVVVLTPQADSDWKDRIQIIADNNELYDKEDAEQQWVGMMRGQFLPDEVVSNRSGGGGGYGDPMEREPVAVLEDVIDGYVTRAVARDEYGVIITEDLEIDHAATDASRARQANGSR